MRRCVFACLDLVKETCLGKFNYMFYKDSVSGVFVIKFKLPVQQLMGFSC